MVMPHMHGHGFIGPTIGQQIRAMPLTKIKKYFPKEYEKEKKRRAKLRAKKKPTKKAKKSKSRR